MKNQKDLLQKIKTILEDSPPISKGGQTIGGEPYKPYGASTKPFGLQNKLKYIGKNDSDSDSKPDQNTNKPSPNPNPQGNFPSHAKPKLEDRDNHIHHFASHISPTTAKPGPGLSILQKPSKENLQYAAHVHEVASKFKDDDQAAEHLHKRMNPKIKSPFAVQPPEYHTLSDDQKNLYKQHVQHMRNVVSGQKFRQLVK